MTFVPMSTVLCVLMSVFLTDRPVDARSVLNYYGCYRDANTRDLSLKNSGVTYLTPTSCDEFCRARGYVVAGVENGNECWCDHDFGTYGLIDEKFCDKPCGGDRNLKCGGSWALGIFSREAYFYMTDPPTTPGHLGCYSDKLERRDLSGPTYTFESDNTPEKCIQQCSSYKYAGVQYGRECSCGNSYGRYGPISRYTCGYQCPGDLSQICGGWFANNVYETGK